MWKRWVSILRQLAHILHWVTMKVFSHQSRKGYAENKRWVFYFLNPVQKCQINYTWTRYTRSQMTATKNQFHVCTSTSCIDVQIRGRWMIYIPDRYYIQISHQVLQFGLQGERSYHKIIVKSMILSLALVESPINLLLLQITRTIGSQIFLVENKRGESAHSQWW